LSPVELIFYQGARFIMKITAFPFHPGRCCLFMARSVLVILMFMCCLGAFGQDYPGPAPVSPDRQAQLLRSLKVTPGGKARIALLLDLSNVNMFRPFGSQNKLDVAMAYAVAARDLGTKVNEIRGYNAAQMVIADIFTMRGDMDSAEKLLVAVDDTTKIKLQLLFAYKYWKATTDTARLKMAEAWASKALAASIVHHLPLYEIWAMKDIALVHSAQAKPGAEKELLEVLKRYQAMKYAKLHTVYLPLAIHGELTGQPVKALRYGLEAVKYMRASADSVAAGDIYLSMASICINNESYQEGFNFANLAISSYKKYAGTRGLDDHYVFWLPVRALRKMKKYDQALQYALDILKKYPPENTDNESWDAKILGDLYRDIKDYRRAAYYLLKSRNLAGPRDKFLANKDVAQLYVESGQYTKARTYLYQLIEDPRYQVISMASKSHINYMLFLADSASGDYRSALARMSAYRRIADSVERNNQIKELTRLEVDYKTKEKENEIKLQAQNILLLKQNANIQGIRLKDERTEKNLVAIIVLIFMLISVLLYVMYRNKRRTSLMLEKKNDLIAQNNLTITDKNNQLEALVHEKEWLLKEVHHRVKNNLHTVICLLESQAYYLENDALRAIEKTQHRIYTMSLIHQKLYQSEDIKTIDMFIYIPELVQYLKDSFEIPERIWINLQIGKISLPAAQAIPVALIINEMVTNAVKYAFPGGCRGEVYVSLQYASGGLRLEVADNGVGIGAELMAGSFNSLGMELIKGLGKELKGDIKLFTEGGVRVIITFGTDLLTYMDVDGVAEYKS